MCLLTLGMMGCGGSDNGVSKKETGADGRVFVRNETGTLNPDSREVDITVKYTDADGNTHTTVVSAGVREEVTAGQLMKGGEQVRLTVVAVQSEGRGSNYSQTVRIRTTPVDGNVEIRILAVRDGQQLEGSGFEIE